jgi:histidine triad (HIT) family protein
MDCVFCKFASHELDPEEVFFEDEKVIVKLDRDWSVKGHTLVIWKEHAVNMSDLSEEDFVYFSKIVRKTEGALFDVLQVDRSIVLKSGGFVPHFHFHIYPVKSTMPWDEIQKLFVKGILYEPKEGEAESLLESLREVFDGR